MIRVKFSLTLPYELLFGVFLRIQFFIFPIIDGLVSTEFDYIYFKAFSRLNRLLLYYYCIISYNIACFIGVYQTSLKDPFLPCLLSQWLYNSAIPYKPFETMQFYVAIILMHTGFAWRKTEHPLYLKLKFMMSSSILFVYIYSQATGCNRKSCNLQNRRR